MAWDGSAVATPPGAWCGVASRARLGPRPLHERRGDPLRRASESVGQGSRQRPSTRSPSRHGPRRLSQAAGRVGLRPPLLRRPIAGAGGLAARGRLAALDSRGPFDLRSDEQLPSLPSRMEGLGDGFRPSPSFKHLPTSRRASARAPLCLTVTICNSICRRMLGRNFSACRSDIYSTATCETSDDHQQSIRQSPIVSTQKHPTITNACHVPI